MTLTNTIVAKLAVAFVAVSMMLVAVAPAQAQTADELQATIDALMAQIAALNAQVGGDSMVASAVCPYTWTRPLNMGATGADVMTLQKFLNASADTQVAAAGSAGSPGMETSYYGPATGAAVAKFQTKYRTDILSPLGLVNATTYFGPSTMAHANKLCVTAPTTGDDDGDDTGDDDDTSGPVNLSGEASLDNFEIDSADDDSIEEGDEDAAIAEATIEFTNGDAMITRLDVGLDSVDAQESDPWDTFESISIWVDGDKVAEKSADNKSDYLGDEDDGIIRFSNLDIVAMEDEEMIVTVAATVQGSVDGTNDGNDWNVSIDSMRFVDGDDVTTTEDTFEDIDVNVSFTIEEAGTEDEIVVKTSSNDPDGTTLAVEEDKKSDWYTVLVFDLDTDDSINDISINEIPVTVTLSSSTYANRVDDAELIIDGETITDFDVDSGTSTVVLTFNVDGDVEIDAGDRVEAELMLRFKSLPVAFEGTTVMAQVTGANAEAIDAEGADDLGTDQLAGGATGDTHTLRTEGVIFEFVSEDFSLKTNSDGTAADDEGIFTLKFEVTAFETEVYLPKTAARGNGTTAGATFYTENGGATVTTGTTTSSLTSNASTENNRFRVSEGETKTFTLKVNYDPLTSDFYAIQLNAINFATSAAGAVNNNQVLNPTEDYETDEYSI